MVPNSILRSLPSIAVDDSYFWPHTRTCCAVCAPLTVSSLPAYRRLPDVYLRPVPARYRVPQREMDRRNGDRTAPLRTPTMAGGLFSIDRVGTETLS